MIDIYISRRIIYIRVI